MAWFAWELPAGIVLLALGGDWLVRGASGVAQRMGLSRMLIGVTLVSIGTSMPEMITSVRAALLESPGIAVGNVIGSNITNILLVLGLAAVIYPLATPRHAMRHNGPVFVAATAACVAVVLVGRLDRMVGAVLVGLLVLYFAYSYFRDSHVVSQEAETHDVDDRDAKRNIWLSVFYAVGGVAVLLLGAHWLVDSSIELARAYNVSEAIIGLTIVAIGTSLPEVITSVVAALRKETAIALGNVLGSNIQNILGILGVTAIVHPIDVPVEIASFDVWVMAGATVALILFAATGRELSRREGFVFLLAYVAYMAYLASIAFGWQTGLA